MRAVDLYFEYQRPQKTIYEWWTDLSGRGYVGKALLSIRKIGGEGEKLLVETRWRIMGRSKKLLERLTLDSEEHWIWEPELFGIQITDDFALQKLQNERVALKIHSEMRPRGLKGRLASVIMGRMIERMMVREWEAASEAFLNETMHSDSQR